MSYRMQTNRITCLTPHEMLTGRPMPVPQWRGPYKGPSLEQLEIELKQYMQQLTMIHRSIYVQEKQKEPETVQGEGRIKPGDQVYLRVFWRKWNKPRREGPFTVTKASPTAVQVEGRSTWYHLNHCTRAVLQGQSGEVSERFINYTDDALEALGQQLDATSRMAWQNRQVLDWLLAEKGGVCVMFREQCCTFIPNNTSPEGSFTRAMNKLKNLRTEVKQNAGFGHQFFDWLESRLGGWGAWLTKIAITVSIILFSCALLLCCFLPCLKSLVVCAATKQFPMLVAITEASLVEKETPKMYRYSLQHLQDEQKQNDSVGVDCKGC
ncbi:uncharacterized protein [Hemitrygon akajei]|uniref:uncharacterized protein n=1 Tax=Hemitrygon akajei TaxID=2704970 RepID=UPI003BF9A343